MKSDLKINKETVKHLLETDTLFSLPMKVVSGLEMLTILGKVPKKMIRTLQQVVPRIVAGILVSGEITKTTKKDFYITSGFTPSELLRFVGDNAEKLLRILIEAKDLDEERQEKEKSTPKPSCEEKV